VLTAVVNPVLIVAHQPKVILSSKNATDLYCLPRGSNLMMTNRGSTEAAIICSLEIDVLTGGLASQEKKPLNSISLAPAGEINFGILKHFNIILFQ
jgi:hypothetical protein